MHSEIIEFAMADNKNTDGGEVATWGLSPEPFVDAEAAARFLKISRRQLLAMARSGAVPAYPVSLGSCRKQWRFRLSELADAISRGLRKPVGRSAARVDNTARQARGSRKGEC